MCTRLLALVCCALFLTAPSFSQSSSISVQGFVWDDANGDGDFAESESLFEGWTVYLDANNNQVFDEGEDSQSTDASGTFVFRDLAAGSYTARLDHTSDWGIAHPFSGAYVFTLAEGEMQDFVDFGVSRLAPTPIGDFVWLDTNENGVQDANEQGIGGISLYLMHARNDQIADSTTTDDAGRFTLNTQISGPYFIAAFPPDTYAPTTPNEGDKVADSDLDPTRPFMLGTRTGWRTGDFQAFSGTLYSDYDIGLRSTSLATSSIGDVVWHDDNQNGVQETGEAGIANVTLNLREAGSDGLFNTTDDNTSFTPAVTATDGSYAFATLAPGTYRVEVDASTLPLSHVPTYDADGTLDHQTEVTITTASSSHTLADFGYIEGTTIGDFTWRDDNGNGVQDSGEPGLRDVVVTLHAPDGTALQSATSNTVGFYSITAAPGDYYLHFAPPTATYHLSPSNQTNDAADSDADPSTFQTQVFTVAAGVPMPEWDAGFFEQTEIGNLVWSDHNGNGQQDSGELGISGISVTLFDHTGLFVGTTTTDTNGRYLFTGLAPNRYLLEFQAPMHFSFSPKDVGGDDTNDSDADRTTGRTDVFAITSGTPGYTWDVGLYPTATVAFAQSTSTTSTEGPIGHIIELVLRIPGGGTLNQSVTAEITDTSTGTATSGLDYSSVGTLTALFPTGSSDGHVQTVTLRTLDDALFEGDETVDLDLHLIGPADLTSPETHTVTIPDDDNPAIFVTPTSGLITDEGGGSASFDMSINGLPSADVTVNLTHPNPQEGTLSASSVVFTAANWHTPQQITITGVDDALADGDQTYAIITDPSISGDANFNAIDPSDVSVTNQDDDIAGLWINVQGNRDLVLETEESGTSETIYVHLDTQPTHDVTLSLTSTDISEGTVSVSQLVFTPTNWGTGQPFQVTGVDDAIADGDQAYQIQLAISTVDPNYAALPLSTLDATNEDDEYAVSGRVWNDANQNGIQDSGEVGMPDIQVELRESSSSHTLVSTLTDADGLYRLVGSFTSSSSIPVQVYGFLDLPAAYAISARNRGSDPTLDSDFANLTDRTSPFFLRNGDDTTHVDAGLRDASFCGTYTIGSGGDYSSFDTAIYFLQTYGLTCATTFLVKPGSYAESRALTLANIPGISATHTLTFEAEDQHNKPQITYAEEDPLFTIEEPHITFSGLAIATTHQAIFSIQADDVVIESCNLSAVRTEELNQDPILEIGETSSLRTSPYTGILISQNSFSSSSWAIASDEDIEATIEHNTFSDHAVALGGDGAEITINDNTFSDVNWGILGNTSGTANISNNTFVDIHTGAILLSECNQCMVESNFIFSPGSPGISLTGTNGTINSTRIANNMIAAADSGIVIWDNAHDVDIFHNSVRSDDIALYVGGGSNRNVRVVNNILLNEGAASTSQSRLAYQVMDQSVLAESDYNVYYSSNSTFSLALNRIMYSTITAYTRASGRDAHSIIKAPSFISPDLHLTGSSRGDTDLAGTNLFLSDDFDGDARLSTCPYRGADESSPALCNTAYLRVLNGISEPTIESVQARINGESIAERVVFREGTPWLDLTPGTYAFSLHGTGSNKADAVLLEKTITVEANHRYVLTASGVRPDGRFAPNPEGKKTDIDLTTLSWPYLDQVETPDAWITLTHAVSDAGPLSLSLLDTHQTLSYGESARLPLVFPEDWDTATLELTWENQTFRFALTEDQLRRWQGETLPLLLSGFRSPLNNPGGALLNLHALVEPDSAIALTPLGYVAGTLWNDFDGNGKIDWAEPAFAHAPFRLLHADTLVQTLAPNKSGHIEAWLPQATYTLMPPDLPQWHRSDALANEALVLQLSQERHQITDVAIGMHERAATFRVRSRGDAPDQNPGDGTCADASGACTLRAALEEANASPGRDAIQFEIPNNGPDGAVIQPTASLPAITEAVVLQGDGKIILDGSQAGPETNGLILSKRSTLADVTIQGFSGNGLVVTSATPSRILRTRFASNKKGGLALNSDAAHFLSENTFSQNEGFAIRNAHRTLEAPILEARSDADQRISGYVLGQPLQAVQVELYASMTCLPAGTGERFLGAWNGSTDAEGRWTFSLEASFVATDGLTAIVQDTQGATSTFSTCLAPTMTPTAKTSALDALPQNYALASNYPNPFNPTTTMSFSLPEQSRVTIRVFDMTGRQVAERTNTYAPGHHKLSWNASGWASGVYVVHFSAQSDVHASRQFQGTQKWVLLK